MSADPDHPPVDARFARQAYGDGSEQRRLVSRTLLTTVGAIVGIAAGSFGMFLSISDRSKQDQKDFEARITAQVKKEMTVENRLTRLEERYEALRATVWTREQQATGNKTQTIVVSPTPQAAAATAEAPSQ